MERLHSTPRVNFGSLCQKGLQCYQEESLAKSVGSLVMYESVSDSVALQYD